MPEPATYAVRGGGQDFLHPSWSDNPSIDDLHNAEYVNGRWRLKPAVVEKRLLQSHSRKKEKQTWKKLPEIGNNQKQGDPGKGTGRIA